MQIYLSGPMSNIPWFNLPAFDDAAKRLRALGHEVFSPAENDLDVYNADISNPTGSVEQAKEEYGFDRAAALKADLAWICEHADAIVMLPGWEASSGARAELALADALGLRVFGPDLDVLAPSAARDVMAERRRQIDVEGWTTAHDDAHPTGELASAAGSYALHAFDSAPSYPKFTPAWWPWARHWWKPGTPRAMLVKAGALILAAIESLDRSNA